MTQDIIKIKRSHPEAKLPQYAHPDDSGADVYSVEECTLEPLQRAALGTGISVEIPLGLEIQIRPKSGLALNDGITVLNTPGTIDAGYRGEIKVILINLSSESVLIKKGQKIAQLVVMPVVKVDFVEVMDLVDSARGNKGFGSTGLAWKEN